MRNFLVFIDFENLTNLMVAFIALQCIIFCKLCSSVTVGFVNKKVWWWIICRSSSMLLQCMLSVLPLMTCARQNVWEKTDFGIALWGSKGETKGKKALIIMLLLLYYCKHKHTVRNDPITLHSKVGNNYICTSNQKDLGPLGLSSVAF